MSFREEEKLKTKSNFQKSFCIYKKEEREINFLQETFTKNREIKMNYCNSKSSLYMVINLILSNLREVSNYF